MSAGRRSLLALLLLVSASGACSKDSLTQIVVVVNSDWDGFDRITIDIAGFTQKNSLDVPLSKKLPRRVALVHDGGPLGPLSVTVSAYAMGMPDDPVLVETRSKIFFVEGQTRMLEIDLPYQCIERDACKTGQTCIVKSTGPTCASNDGASTLMPWTGDVSAVVKYHVKDGDVLGAGGSSAGGADGTILSDSGPVQSHADGGPRSDGSALALDAGQHDAGAGPDAGRDAGKIAVDSGPGALFPYAPSNFNPTNAAIASLARVAVTLNCGTSAFNSTDRTFSGWCGMKPASVVIKQLDGATDAVVLVMSALEVASGSSLKLTGSLPVILAVMGDAHIDGSVDASATGATPGPGADIGCGSASSLTGPTAQSFYGAGGGGGAGFGSAGGAGGIRNGGTGVSGEGVSGNAALVPLRGGCSGGRGGVTTGLSPAPAGGAGGGAVQISAAGMLQVTGTINAAGGGGAAASSQLGGGGGGGGGGAGGSGGGILLEGSNLVIGTAAVISANGGSGAAGQSTSTNGKPGEDGLAGTAPAVGGKAGSSSTAGDGGSGGALTSAAAAGADPSYVTSGGGGGGGGVGRIRVQQASSCALPGMLSPAASIVCPSCGGVCP